MLNEIKNKRRYDFGGSAIYYNSGEINKTNMDVKGIHDTGVMIDGLRTRKNNIIKGSSSGLVSNYSLMDMDYTIPGTNIPQSSKWGQSRTPVGPMSYVEANSPTYMAMERNRMKSRNASDMYISKRQVKPIKGYAPDIRKSQVGHVLPADITKNNIIKEAVSQRETNIVKNMLKENFGGGKAVVSNEVGWLSKQWGRHSGSIIGVGVLAVAGAGIYGLAKAGTYLASNLSSNPTNADRYAAAMAY